MRSLTILLLLGAPLWAYEKLSPFTEVRFDGATPIVRYDGDLCELVELDGLKAADIVAFCRKTYGRRWEKRFAEDLVEVLHRMGRKPGRTVRLVLNRDGERVEVARAAMTNENRDRVRDARRALRRTGLTEAQAAEDFATLRALLEERHSYLRGRALAWEPRALSRDAFAVELAKRLAPLGDGHLRVRGLEGHLPRAYLPFLVGVDGERLFALAPDRSRVLGQLRAIDGVPVARWLEKAQSISAHGSPQFRLWQGARNLRLLGFLRDELGLAHAPTVRVELEDGRAPFALPVARRKPVYGTWPRTTSRVIDGIGYLRIASMDPNHDAANALRKLGDTKGLILDVRGNRGGTRDILRALLPFFLDAPRVVNAAKYRLGREAEDPQGHLDNRFLYPVVWKGWTDTERRAIRAFARDFEPAWEPGAGFSRWHYMVVGPGAERYREPVVVLMDPDCFSATDIFLGAFRGVRGVTLLGLPSGGGSGRSQSFTLPHSGIEVRASSMASFQPGGQPYDGLGVQPDVVVHPKPSDWTGATDTLLDAALERLRR